MLSDLMDTLNQEISKRGRRGQARKTALYPLWKYLRALPMYVDYRMINLYSRKHFRDMLNDTAATNWISLWLQSFQRPPEDPFWALALKDPLPWINFRAVCYLEYFLMTRPQPIVFEYGSGASTLWFAKRCHRLVSVEHHREWHSVIDRILQERSFSNVDYYLQEPQPIDITSKNLDYQNYLSALKPYQGQHFEVYCKIIDKDQTKYDLIFVDGKARSGCLQLAREHIKPGGLIVLDNSGRERYRSAIEMFSDWKVIKTTGPVSYGENVEETTFFRHS